MNLKNLFIALAFTIGASAGVFAQTVIVTPSNTQGWTGVPPGADTRPGGTVQITAFPDSHGGNGSLQLTTDSGAAKAQYMHAANVPLSDVSELAYSTYQQAANVPEGDPSYQLPVCLGGFDTSGNCIGFTTLVYEPYWNGTVAHAAWQTWDVDAGLFWSSRDVNLSTSCQTSNGAGGPPFYTLSTLSIACPDAVVIGYGVDVGSGNPNYIVHTDYFDFNGTTYNFEMYQVPTTAEQCKNGGWMTLKRTGGVSGFKNQGDCIQYVNTGK